MAKENAKNIFMQLMWVAMAITVASAVLYGFSWLLPENSLTSLSNVLVVTMSLGGMAMGLFYACSKFVK